MMLKTLAIFVLASFILGTLTTFYIFPIPANTNYLQREYPQVFKTFGNNAEKVSKAYGKPGLEFLKDYNRNGLFLVEKYGNGLSKSMAFFDKETLYGLYTMFGDRFDALSNLLHPATISDFYGKFGKEGISYLLEDPENYFLFQVYGSNLLPFTQEKGDVVLPMVRRHGLEFVKKYYDEHFLDRLIHFGEDFITALKKYDDKAQAVFQYFDTNEKFQQVLERYGYHQVIPILYYFLQENKADESLNSMEELGNNYLDRFEILEDGQVVRQYVATGSNALGNFFTGGAKQYERKKTRGEPVTNWDRLAVALDILGILPVGAIFSKGAKAAVVGKGLKFAKTSQGVKGLVKLSSEEAALLAKYGEEIIPFVAKHGEEGIRVLQKATGEEVLSLSRAYGDEVVKYGAHYGDDAIKAINRYGDDLLKAASKHGDTVIPLTAKYGDTGLQAVNTYGKDLVRLSELYGDKVTLYASRYGDDFLNYVTRYGDDALKVVERYGDDVIQLARRNGDDVIPYLARYGDEGFKLAQQGKVGMTILKSFPEKAFIQYTKKALKYGLLGGAVVLLFTYPSLISKFLGSLGEYLGLPTFLFPFLFWSLIFFIGFLVVWFIYRMVSRFV
jgi:hypothetical protein